MAMKNLGEILKEAREAKGLSIRDVAEETRLRIDILENMESGTFDYKLPEIYKRGFLRIYASFLRLDEKAVMNQYSRMPLHKAQSSTTSIHQFESDEAPEEVSYVPTQDTDDYEAPEESKSPFSDIDTAKYLKIGGLIVSLLLAVIVIILVISSFSASQEAKTATSAELAPNTDISLPTDAPATEVSNSAINEIPSKNVIKVTATKDTYVTIFPKGEESNKLFAGSIQAGESKEFKTSKTLTIQATDAERISVSRDGKKLDLKGAKGMIRFNIKIKQ